MEVRSCNREAASRLRAFAVRSTVAKRSPNTLNLGFTLIETMIAIVIVGILAAIATPSWIALINTRRLNYAQDQVHRALLEAQSNAKRDKITWQVSLQEDDEIVKWAVHPADPNTFIPSGINWQKLDSNIQITKERNDLNQCETTFTQLAASCPAEGPWRLQFDYRGIPKREGLELGQITLNNTDNTKIQRCVYIATILGTIQTGRENSQANSEDRYCY